MPVTTEHLACKVSPDPGESQTPFLRESLSRASSTRSGPLPEATTRFQTSRFSLLSSHHFHTGTPEHAPGCDFRVCWGRRVVSGSGTPTRMPGPRSPGESRLSAMTVVSQSGVVPGGRPDPSPCAGGERKQQRHRFGPGLGKNFLIQNLQSTEQPLCRAARSLVLKRENRPGRGDVLGDFQVH